MKVFINPGHAPDGVPDPGAVNKKTGLKEAVVVKAIGDKVAEYLEKVYIDTKVVQEDSLNKICHETNNWRSDLFVSIHCNAHENASAEGSEVWYHTYSSKGKKLAECIQKQLVDSIGTVDRGAKATSSFYVLNYTSAPAVLVEIAFISNEREEKLLANMQDKIAAAIARGITDYVVENN